MFDKDQKVQRGSVAWRLLHPFNTAKRPSLAAAALASLIMTLAASALGQANTQQKGPSPSLATVDLIALKQGCGAAQALDASFQLVRQHAFGQRRSNSGEILAFEENGLFIYALADMSGLRDAKDSHWFRRFFLLKPSTFVVEDLLRTPGTERPTRWLLRSAGEPEIEDGRMRVVEAGVEILGHSLLPVDANLKKRSNSRSDRRPAGNRVAVTPRQASHETRFLQVFSVRSSTEQNTLVRPTVTTADKHLELTVAAHGCTFELTLPLDASAAGKIKVTADNEKTLLPQRLLPSGIMPHGPEGARLLERWDAPYRRDRPPGWDVGRSSTHLAKAVEDGTFQPGRAIVLGCGTGSSVLYLASKGFEVTGVDVAPTALALAADKARKAGAKIDWVLADAVALPKLAAFDLIFDRGCYHHICQYNSAGYVETLRRLSHGGTRALILAGSPADGQSGGPPRIPEETIRKDFSGLFEFGWLRSIHFDTRDPDGQGPSAWSIHLRRKDE